jgi:hypothetical protein
MITSTAAMATQLPPFNHCTGMPRNLTKATIMPSGKTSSIGWSGLQPRRAMPPPAAVDAFRFGLDRLSLLQQIDRDALQVLAGQLALRHHFNVANARRHCDNFGQFCKEPTCILSRHC